MDPENTAVSVEVAPTNESAEAGAVEALARVAEQAIDQTAERIDELARATARIASMENEIDSLRQAFAEHVNGNQADFMRVAETLTQLETGMQVMRESLNAVIEAEESEEEEEAEEIAQLATDVADVAAAEAAEAAAHAEQAPESAPVLDVEPPSPHNPGGRARRQFVRIF